MIYDRLEPPTLQKGAFKSDNLSQKRRKEIMKTIMKALIGTMIVFLALLTLKAAEVPEDKLCHRGTKII